MSSFFFKGAMMSVAFKEGLKIPPQAMEQIIIGANQDVRQVGQWLTDAHFESSNSLC